FARNSRDILKSIWGHQLHQYPIKGYGSDSFVGTEPDAFTVVRQDSATASLAADTTNGQAEKTFSLQGGHLTVSLHFRARASARGRISTAPRLDISPEVFGAYPKLFVGKGSGWQLVELGKAGSMWYQAAAIPIEDFSGAMLLIAEKGDLGLELRIPPKQLGEASYMYDRYDFQPKGTGRLLELTFAAPERTFLPGDTQSLEVTYHILEDNEIPDISQWQ
ncbi:MAG: hypothetical protein IJJ33_05220, partial [Victivallales bacterium]|nr:hypothetical protein [Victivallales bacterium]